MKAESISLKDFRAGKFEIKHSAAEHPILIFLRRNNRAFNVAALVKVTKLSGSAVRSMLRKLKKQGLILHKPPFFAYKR